MEKNSRRAGIATGNCAVRAAHHQEPDYRGHVERYLSAGEFAQAQPILRIAQLDPLNVELVLPSDVYGKVREGSQAEVSLLEPI